MVSSGGKRELWWLLGTLGLQFYLAVKNEEHADGIFAADKVC